MAEAGFWDNPEKAQATVAELKGINTILKPLEEALSASADVQALAELVAEDVSMEPELASETDRLQKMVDALEMQSLLSGPHDASDALVPNQRMAAPRHAAVDRAGHGEDLASLLTGQTGRDERP